MGALLKIYTCIFVQFLSNFSCGKTVWMRLKASPALKGLTQFPASNDEKYLYSCRNRHQQYWIIWLTKNLPKNCFIKFNDSFVDLKHTLNRLYTGLAGQGLRKIKQKFYRNSTDIQQTFNRYSTDIQQIFNNCWPFILIPITPEGIILPANFRSMILHFWKQTDFPRCSTMKICMKTV